MSGKDMLLLGFVTGSDLTVYTVISGRVRTRYRVGLAGGGSSVCGCPVFRHEGRCDHSAMATAVAMRNVEVLGDSTYTGEEAGSFVHIAKPLSADRLVYVVRASDCKNLSLHEFVNVVLVGRAPLRGPEDADSGLSIDRIQKQCYESERLAIGIDDPGIIRLDGTSPSKPRPATTTKAAEPVVEEDESLVPESSEDQPEADRAWCRRRPSESLFWVPRPVWEAILFGIHTGANVLLLGPSGSGKTELAYLAAKAYGVGLEAFNCGAMSEPRSSLIGNTHFDAERGTWFQESRFVRAIRDAEGTGCVVLLDEITRAVRSAFNILLPLMDGQRYVACDESESGEVIKRGERVGIVATANVGVEYTGTEEMDRALRDRFAMTVHMEFPPAEVEAKILERRCGVSPGVAARLVSVAGTQRRLAVVDGEFTEQISTRMLLAAGRAVKAGFSMEDACRFAIEGCFSGDGGDLSDRTKIRQIIQKGGLS